jgi:hypothetical protein
VAQSLPYLFSKGITSITLIGLLQTLGGRYVDVVSQLHEIKEKKLHAIDATGLLRREIYPLANCCCDFPRGCGAKQMSRTGSSNMDNLKRTRNASAAQLTVATT